MSAVLRHDWSRDQVLTLFTLPFPELMHRAATTHRENFDPREVQVSTLLSIKTGGCPEDCAYCPQSARYNTGLKAHKLLSVEEVIEKATALGLNPISACSIVDIGLSPSQFPGQ